VVVPYAHGSAGARVRGQRAWCTPPVQVRPTFVTRTPGVGQTGPLTAWPGAFDLRARGLIVPRTHVTTARLEGHPRLSTEISTEGADIPLSIRPR
jgi:hypothetical protein